MIKQDSKNPLFKVTLQMAEACEPTLVLGPDGKPAAVVRTFGPEQEITVHAKDDNEASEYVKQQNPSAKIVRAEKVE